MLHSMTAYTQLNLDSAWGSIHWELRAVNHRYLDLNLRLADGLRHLEPAIRSILCNTIKRGKVDINLQFHPNEQGHQSLHLNPAAAADLARIINELNTHLPNVAINTNQLLSWPGLLSQQKQPHQGRDDFLLQSFQQALGDLRQQRKTEGDGISAALNTCLADLAKHIGAIEAAYDPILSRMQAKIRARLDHLKADIDQHRYEQEIVYMLNKCDIAEECQRFNTHLKAIAALLEQSGPMGKKCDFYAQELHREANTMGNKLLDMDISQHIVHIKVGIEQLREQAQNME